jgi:hypothetical protein
MRYLLRLRLALVLALFVSSVAQSHAQSFDRPARPDLGDAPDTTNGLGGSMSAYPGVVARFPTVATAVGGGPAGPLHRNDPPIYYLGDGLSAEEQADQGADSDGFNNLRPLSNSADNDALDDGLALPHRMGHCVEHTLVYRVTSRKAAAAFLNIWVDWDRDGAWNSAALACPGAAPVAEWAAQNLPLKLAPERHELRVTIRTWRPDPNASVWLRISLSEQQAPSDGSSPPNPYALGETEDYLLELAGLPQSVTPPTLRPQAFEALTSSPPGHRVYLPLAAGTRSGPPAPDLPEGTPDGQLREVEVAHVGGLFTGTNRPILVTAAGSGAGVRLGSWAVEQGTQTPTFLRDGPGFPGHTARLHVLTPEIAPKANYELLLSAVIREGDLWLTSWRLDTNGQFTQLSSRGYGRNAEVAVEAYAIAHREARRDGSLQAFQVVTPLRTANRQLRTVTWSVNATTGAINGLQDSGSWDGDLSPTTQLAATKIAGNAFLGDYFAVSYRTAGGVLANSFWGVSPAGAPEHRGVSVSGLDIRGNELSGDDEDGVEMRHVAVAPLTAMGMLSATHDGGGETRLISWDNRLACAGDSGCVVQPHFIAEQADDANPNGAGVSLPQPALTANRALLLDPQHDDTLFERNVGGTGAQGIASVTKVMTLILALDAIADGNADLDDLVTTSAAAANVGGSQMAPPLVEGEVQTLETLLYGLMVNSGNDAALAIAEHIGGSQADFATMMNARAAQLGMSSTVYCQAAGGCFSTPADQVALWRSAYTDPDFLRFVGPVDYQACGEGPSGEEICRFIERGPSVYPGQEGAKNGSLGFFCPQEPSTDGVPLCASNGCLSAQATRLDRTLLQTILQPGALDADTGTDSRALWDYGYRLLYTPDARGEAEAAGPAPDFGLDSINDGLAVTAVIDGQNVRLCTWDAFAPAGTLGQRGCATRAVHGLAAGTMTPAPTEVRLLLRSSFESDGDYLLGHRDGNELVLSLWRLGPHQ